MTTQFDGLATTYADARPDYPDDAMRFVLQDLHGRHAAASGSSGDKTSNLRVVDIGYGTGIATGALLRAAASLQPAPHLHIQGVEPGADMRAVANTRGPRIAALHGTRAEQTGLPDHCCDLVLCAQAFHWFDKHAALREFHRILLPGGRLALIWNLRLEGVDALTDTYNRVVTTSAQLDPLQAARRAELAKPLLDSPQFCNIRAAEFPNPQAVTEDGLVARATSASYFPRAEPERGRAIAELRAAFRAHAASGGGALLHTCQVTLADAAK